MKKSLLALAVAAALPTVALAQSNVTLYGIVDTGVEYLDKDAA
ncbi:MAG: porin, partial [Burkholderiaceae bacterium]